VKSVQELKAANDNLVTENQRLRSTLEEQGRRLKRVERMLEAMGQ
jgi:predicted nuclease with TOPRIM domain